MDTCEYCGGPVPPGQGFCSDLCDENSADAVREREDQLEEWSPRELEEEAVSRAMEDAKEARLRNW